MPRKIKLGQNCKVDEKVMLAYSGGRVNKNSTLIIGNDAVIRAGTIIYAATKIGDKLETGHNAVIREENNIGNNFSIWNNSTIDYGCKIGDNVKVHCNCYVAQFTTLENDVFLAPGVTIANDIHPGCRYSRKCMKGPTIKKGAKIGVNVTILPFVTIGRNAVIGAGSVVTKDIPDNCVACGNPAKTRKTIYKLACLTGLTDKPYKKEVR